MSVGRSDFTGSAEYRINNIGVGMNILNGILIAPGEEFSFNNNIGSIDARNGFVEGYAIIQNRTQLEFGGGICQDSTTLFRAAFWAGLPITERWGHSFYISWYDKYGLGPQGNGPGLDATIFTGGPDLKFVNDTGNWLLMQSSSNARTGVAEVALYGTKPNRTVALPSDQQTHSCAARAQVCHRSEAAARHQPAERHGARRHDDRCLPDHHREWRRKTAGAVSDQLPRLAEYLCVQPGRYGPDGKPLIPFGAQPAPQPTPEPAPSSPRPSSRPRAARAAGDPRPSSRATSDELETMTSIEIAGNRMIALSLISRSLFSESPISRKTRPPQPTPQPAS